MWGKIMLKKGLAIFVILIFLGTIYIPNAIAYDRNINNDLIKPTDLIGRGIYRGFGLFPFYHGDNVTFLAIMFRCTIFTATEMQTYTFILKWITLPRNFVHNFFIFNKLIYYIGFYQGGIEIK